MLVALLSNECKRRKIKCNGETPCQRCGNLNLACLYAPNCCSNSFKDSDEYRAMSSQLAQLQEQVDDLSQTMTSLRSETLRLAPIQEKSHKMLPFPSAPVAASPSNSISSHQRPEMAHVRPHAFRGPTSMAFSLDVARDTIHNMGYRPPDDGEDQTAASSDEGPSRGIPIDTMSDPLWEIGKDEMVRLCRLYVEELGIMYPVITIQDVIEHARNLSAYMDSTLKANVAPDMFDDQTLLLKMIIVCALVVEEHGQSERATRLFDNAEPFIYKKLLAEPCNFHTIPLMALVSAFRFLSGDEVLAWRIGGQVVRLCIELGIHQRAGLMKIPTEDERRFAINSFWAVYVLDRRWAFGTGLPYVVQDEDIDPELPMPVSTEHLGPPTPLTIF